LPGGGRRGTKCSGFTLLNVADEVVCLHRVHSPKINFRGESVQPRPSWKSCIRGGGGGVGGGGGWGGGVGGGGGGGSQLLGLLWLFAPARLAKQRRAPQSWCLPAVAVASGIALAALIRLYYYHTKVGRDEWLRLNIFPGKSTGRSSPTQSSQTVRRGGYRRWRWIFCGLAGGGLPRVENTILISLFVDCGRRFPRGRSL